METGDKNSFEKKMFNELRELGSDANQYRSSILGRFPFLVIGLSTYGLVATLYGFEKIIDSLQWFEDRPYIVLLSGLVALAITGTLYKKLG